MVEKLSPSARPLVHRAFAVMALALAACGGGGGGSSDLAAAAPAAPALRGQFTDAPVGGLNYVTTSASGLTDANGFFNYSQPGEDIQFFVGAVPIGRAQASPTIHVFDLAGTRDDLASGVNVKVAQLLQSMDTNAGKSNSIQLPASLASKLTDPGAIDLTTNQLAFDASLKSALAKVGATTTPVSASVAKEKAAAYISEVVNQCPLPAPKSPDFSLTGPYAIKTGSLTCLDRAKVNYFIQRINPFLTIQIDSAGQQIDLTQTAYSDTAAQAALDASPVIAGLMGLDAALGAVEAAKQEQTALAALSVAKFLTAKVRVVVDAVVTVSPSDGSAIGDAARANQYIKLTDKVIDTLGSTTSCVSYFSAEKTSRKTEDFSGCSKAISHAVEVLGVGLELPLFSSKALADQATMRASLDVIADGFAGIAEVTTTLSAAADSTAKLQRAADSAAKLRRAVFGLSGAMVKTARDSITLAYVSKGQDVPTTGWNGFAIGILDNVATPVLAVASECYGVTKANPTEALKCASTQAQEVLKSSTKLAFTLVGAVETIRATNHLNEAIVTREVLSEMLWAGQANIDGVYAKYGVTFTPDVPQSRLKSETELVKQIASKKLQLAGVASSADWAAIISAGTWQGSSFSIEDVLMSVHQYLNMIDQNTAPGVTASALAMFGKITLSAPTCTIPSDANNCNVSLSWGTALPVSTSKVTSNSPNANTPVATGNSGSATVSVPYGDRTFYLYNNEQELATAKAFAVCAAGTSWNGNKCQASTMSGTLNSSAPTCTIVAGASSCDVNLNWNTTNPVLTSAVTWDYPAANTTLASGNSGGPLAVSVPRGIHVVYLSNNGRPLANLTVSANCVADTAWSGSSCQSATNSQLVAPNLVSPIGNVVASSLTPTLQWSGGTAILWQVNIRNLVTNVLTPSAPLPPTATTYAVPSGVLAAGTPYRWDVTACPDAACNDSTTYRVSVNGLFTTPPTTAAVPTVASISCGAPVVARSMTCMVTGTDLPATGMTLTATNCVPGVMPEQSGGSATGRTFACTPTAPGVLSITSANVPGFTGAITFPSYSVTSNALPSVSTLACVNATVGQVMTCTASGTNLTSANIVLSSPVCVGWQVVGTGTPQQQAFTCTPSSAGTTSVSVSGATGGSLLLTQSLIVGPAASLNARFVDNFNDSGFGTTKWATIGSPSMANGIASFPAFANASTAGKFTVSGNIIVVESRFVGPSAVNATNGTGRDTWIALIDVATGAAIHVGDTSYRQQANQADGMYYAASGIFNLAQKGNGTTAATYKEYRLTVSGASLTLERGDSLSNPTETLTATLGATIVGKTFYLEIGTGASAYSPGNFDWITVKADVAAVRPNAVVSHFEQFGCVVGTTQPVVIVNWDVALGAASYVVMRLDASGYREVFTSERAPSSWTDFSLTSANSGQGLYYTVKARNSAGDGPEAPSIMTFVGSCP